MSIRRAVPNLAVADISVEVEDVDAVWETMRSQGVEVVHPITDEPWGVRRFFVREPGGRVVNVLTHPPMSRLVEAGGVRRAAPAGVLSGGVPRARKGGVDK
jgi:catechol 2,3-dioxygenase-like lactoylglutathione lyase family enzyme